jgi:hypothetical protein
MSHIYEGKQCAAHVPATCGHMRRMPFLPSFLPAARYRLILRLSYQTSALALTYTIREQFIDLEFRPALRSYIKPQTSQSLGISLVSTATVLERLESPDSH